MLYEKTAAWTTGSETSAEDEFKQNSEGIL